MLDGTNTSIGYRAYLMTEAWAKRRDAALERAKHRCQVCNSPADVEVHHRTYERVTNELPEDLTVLCARCHGFFHDVVGAVTSARTVRSATAVDVNRANGEWKRREKRRAEKLQKQHVMDGRKWAIEQMQKRRPADPR